LKKKESAKDEQEFFTPEQWRSQPWTIGQLPNSLKVIAQ
jgi:hypothetical protein